MLHIIWDFRSKSDLQQEFRNWKYKKTKNRKKKEKEIGERTWTDSTCGPPIVLWYGPHDPLKNPPRCCFPGMGGPCTSLSPLNNACRNRCPSSMAGGSGWSSVAPMLLTFATWDQFRRTKSSTNCSCDPNQLGLYMPGLGIPCDLNLVPPLPREIERRWSRRTLWSSRFVDDWTWRVNWGHSWVCLDGDRALIMRSCDQVCK
jgi:hypothetical protein